MAAWRCWTWRTAHCCGCLRLADCLLHGPLPVHEPQPCPGEFACAAFVAGARDDSASTGTRLLEDLRTVLGDADALPTQVIRDRLHALEEAPWGEWYGHQLTARELAGLLSPYGVRPRRIRAEDVTPGARGYTRADLHDAWARYLSRGSATSATSATALARDVADVALVADTPQACAVCGDPLDPALAAAGDATHPTCDPEGETVKLSSRPAIDRCRSARAPKEPQCRICLLVTDDLRKGVCRDRAACEARQLTLDQDDRHGSDGRQSREGSL